MSGKYNPTMIHTIPEATIAQARNAEILEIARNNGYEPEKKGSQYWIRDPHHEDKTPSVALSVEKNAFFCHSCGACGDPIAFQQYLAGTAFPDAVRAIVGDSECHHSLPDVGKLAYRQIAEARRKKLEREKREAVALAGGKRESIIKESAWSPIEALAESPIRPVKKVDQWKQLLSVLYPDRDAVVWLGEFYDSGQPRHAAHFRAVADWLTLTDRPASRIAPATFLPGSYQRSGTAVATTPYIVVEADEAIGRKPVTDREVKLNRRSNYALLKWLRDETGLTLRAIIDTGNKSAHGWFEHPGEEQLSRLAMVAPGLGIDDLLSKPAQPVRLPNVPHEKHLGYYGSSLVYLAS